METKKLEFAKLNASHYDSAEKLSAKYEISIEDAEQLKGEMKKRKIATDSAIDIINSCLESFKPFYPKTTNLFNKSLYYEIYDKADEMLLISNLPVDFIEFLNEFENYETI